MSNLAADPAATDSAAVPFESVPALAANDAYIEKMTRLRDLKALKDQLFNDKEPKSPGDLPLGEYEGLKRECAAMQLINGQKSVAFFDLRVMSAAGGVTKGKVTGAGIIDSLGDATPQQLRAIALAAKECDPEVLVSNGISASVVVAARTPDKPRAGSVRVEWIGAKGRGAGQKTRGTGGDVQ